MLKKELEQEIERLEDELNRERRENRQKDEDIEELEKKEQKLEEGIRLEERSGNYVMGQLEVLKRVSRLYPEEIPTREEYKELRLV